MEIILAESIKNLGEQGDVVKVRPGYARNYLIPKGFAYPVNTANAAELRHRRQMVMDQQRRRVKTETDLARVLGNTRIHIQVKVGEEDKLFGSVTSKDIAEALAKKDIVVDRRKIQLDEPIRSLGSFTVPVRFAADITAELNVTVDKEK